MYPILQTHDQDVLLRWEQLFAHAQKSVSHVREINYMTLPMHPMSWNGFGPAWAHLSIAGQRQHLMCASVATITNTPKTMSGQYVDDVWIMPRRRQGDAKTMPEQQKKTIMMQMILDKPSSFVASATTMKLSLVKIRKDWNQQQQWCFLPDVEAIFHWTAGAEDSLIVLGSTHATGEVMQDNLALCCTDLPSSNHWSNHRTGSSLGPHQRAPNERRHRRRRRSRQRQSASKVTAAVGVLKQWPPLRYSVIRYINTS